MLKFELKKLKNQHVKNKHAGNDYILVTLPRLYLTITRIIKRSLKSIGKF